MFNNCLILIRFRKGLRIKIRWTTLWHPRRQDNLIIHQAMQHSKIRDKSISELFLDRLIVFRTICIRILCFINTHVIQTAP